MNNNLKLPLIPDTPYVDAIPSMYAPHRKYVTGLIPLMLSHVWSQITTKSIQPGEALADTGWLARLITLDKRVLHLEKQNEIPGWHDLQDRLIQQLAECKSTAEIPAMTVNCLHILDPVIASRFVNEYRFPAQKFHCWWWTIHDDNTHLALHLINAYQPASPFQHLPHFLQTMSQAIDEAIAQYPGIRVISCGSWLNQVPKFQQLWPESFRRNQKILNETGGFGPGAWGQYMTTDGGFNDAKADLLLKTGRHPFALTEGRSSLHEVQDHLNQLRNTL